MARLITYVVLHREIAPCGGSASACSLCQSLVELALLQGAHLPAYLHEG